MHLKRLTIVAATALALGCSAAEEVLPVAGAVRFQAHDIDEIPGGYAVAVADFNNDGRLDVMANSLRVPELVWHENPTWERHVIVEDVPSLVNLAIADITGDGIPEVAFQTGFAMVPASSEGHNWVATSQGDPTMPWKTEAIDDYPTSHHVTWADLDGDGELELVNALLLGAESLGPTYTQDQASVFWYGQDGWNRGLVSDEVPGIIHRVRTVRWDEGDRDQILVASFEGVGLYRSTGSGAGMTFEKELITSGHDSEPAPRLGASDVGVGTSNGERIFATVEPWHGNEVVVYTEEDGAWQRRVIWDQVQSGHEVHLVDLNGDGRGDIIANDNSRVSERNPNGSPGVHVFFSPDDPATGEWIYSRIDSEYGMNGCVSGDMNEDGRNDVICAGAGGMIRWYENLGE